MPLSLAAAAPTTPPAYSKNRRRAERQAPTIDSHLLFLI